MKPILTTALILLLCGCDHARNSVREQVEDYKVCHAAGMQAYLNGYSEVRCAPPKEAVNG